MIPHGDSEFFLCPTLVTRRKNIFLKTDVVVKMNAEKISNKRPSSDIDSVILTKSLQVNWELVTIKTLYFI